jgi:hypothetical protein
MSQPEATPEDFIRVPCVKFAVPTSPTGLDIQVHFVFPGSIPLVQSYGNPGTMLQLPEHTFMRNPSEFLAIATGPLNPPMMSEFPGIHVLYLYGSEFLTPDLYRRADRADQVPPISLALWHAIHGHSLRNENFAYWGKWGTGVLKPRLPRAGDLIIIETEYNNYI